MKALHILLWLAAAACLWAQAAEEIPSKTVVATIEGRKFTKEEMQRMIAAMGPQAQKNFDSNPKAFIEQFGLLMKLSNLAEQNKLHNESPYRERIEFARMQILMQAQVDRVSFEINITEEDQKKYYEANLDRYTQARIRVIYIAFVSNPQPTASARKTLSEEEARKKAEDLVKKLRAGADFAELAEQHSDDSTSAQKGGDFGTVKKSDNVPDHIKKAVFALKQGEVSDPVRQPNGFYIFRADEIGTEPFDKAKEEIYKTLQTQQFQKWLDGTRAAVQLKIENEAFFTPKPAQAAPPKP
jgi:parvulin-like peptidyl-prolyl isomerase